MAYRHFQQAGKVAEGGQVEQVQVVSGVQAQAGFLRGEGGFPPRADDVGRRAAARDLRGVGARVQFHPVCAEFGRQTHLCGLGVHEQADAAAQLVHPRYQRLQSCRVAPEVEAMIGGELPVTVRNQCALRRANGCDEFHESRVVADIGPVAPRGTGEGVTLDVQFHGQCRGERRYVARADVALVRARVHGDAVGPGGHDALRVQHEIRVIARA